MENPLDDKTYILKPLRTALTPLCSLCSRFTWNKTTSTLGVDQAFKHHKHLGNLLDSARECRFCAMIRDEVLQGYAWRRFADEPPNVLDINFVRSRTRFETNDLRLSEKSLLASVLLWTFNSPSNSHIRVGTTEWLEEASNRALRSYKTFGDMHDKFGKFDNFLMYTYPRLDVHTFEDDPFQTFGLTCRKSFSRSMSSKAPIHLMRQWINDCVLHHSECTPRAQNSDNEDNTSRLLPNRLLKIDDTREKVIVRLQEYFETQICGKYVALSYCWGSGSHPYLLTTSSFVEFQAGVEYAELPKTYRDAISITLALGLQHLWIDALCIVQDMKNDWEVESQKMDQYYGNSFVTISVNCAENLGRGFLHPRSIGLFEPLHLQQSLPSGETGNLLISRHVYDYSHWFEKLDSYSSGLWRVNVECCPLATRAWALQERVLSPRKLHFGEEEIFWECRHKLDAEGGSSSLGGISQISVAAAALANGNVTVQQWYNLIEKYSARSLTKGSDKLQAVSSLAKLFNSKSGADYRAGLWMNDLHYGLNWRVEGKVFEERNNGTMFPSWSWASVQGAVTFSTWRNIGDDIEEKCGFQLISTPKTSNPFSGAPAIMPIMISGLLQRIVLNSDSPRKFFAPVEYPDPSGQAAATGAIGDYYDDLAVPREGEHYLTLRLVDVPPTAGPSLPKVHDVLVLVTVDEGSEKKDVFRRIGAGTVYHDGWFASCEEQLITLI